MNCRPWALVCLLPNCRRYVVDSFINRSDAEDRLRFLNRSTPQYEYEIVFEMTADPDYWEKLYLINRTPWDISQPAPAFRTLLNSPDAPTPGIAAVLGCGLGYDTDWFATHGFDTTGVDFAPSAIRGARYLAQTVKNPPRFLLRNIFDLADEFPGYFDYVIEHMCFCAIPPDCRQEYARLVSKLLRPKGELIAVFLTHKQPGGPPFGAKLTEICQYFEKDFEQLLFEPVSNSVPSRQGLEYFARFRRA